MRLASVNRAIRAATYAWEREIIRALEFDQSVDDVAAAAGAIPREVRAILRRRS